MTDNLSADLRGVIRTKIAAGLLPPEAPKSVVVRSGSSRACDACDLPISPDERECEVQLRSTIVLWLHQGCLVLWQDEVSQGLAATIRAKVLKGALPMPSAPPKPIWAGKGTGRSCDGCDQRIKVSQIEYETDLPGGPTLFFHPHCLEVWQELRTEPTEISGGSVADPWTMLFDIRIARDASADPRVLEELLAASAEARLAASRTRALSRTVVARTERLLAAGSTPSRRKSPVL